MRFRLISFLTLLFAAFTVAMAQPMVTANLDSAQIRIGSQTRLILKVLSKPGQQVTFPDLQPKSVLTEGIEVVRAGAIDTTEVMGGDMQVERAYIITSFDTTDYRFVAPSVVIGGDTVSAHDTLRLHVTSIPIDTLHTENFFGAKEVVAEPFNMRWVLVAAVVLLHLLMLLALYFFRRWRKVKRRVYRVVVQLPPTPDSVALEAIEKLRQEIPASEDPAEVYDGLVEALRKYIAERYQINTDLQTSPQLIRLLRDKVSETQLDELKTALTASDFVRFANQTDDARREAPFVAAMRFVESTRPAPRVSDTEEREEQEPLGKYRRRKLTWLIAMLVTVAALVVLTIWIFMQLGALI